MDTMQPHEDAQPEDRHVGGAILLSLFGAGIGHIYAGRGRLGAILFAISLLPVPFVFFSSYLPPSKGILLGICLTPGFMLLLVVFAIVDSVGAVRRAARPYSARAYNSTGLYVGLAVLSVGWLFGGLYLVRTYAYEAYRLPTESMLPTVEFDDRILVKKRLPETLSRGDLIVFRPPSARDRVFFKRVIGLPGEEVQVRDGVVFVNGRALANNPVDVDEKGRGTFREGDDGRTWLVLHRGVGGDGEPVTVPAGHVFVLGDHRANSFDSRKFGPVPLGDVIGLAQYVVWPIGEGSRFGVPR